jgi:hypothetical protein
MGLKYLNLDARTRELMQSEIELDAKRGVPVVNSYLTEKCISEWYDLLVEAAKSGTDDSLAGELSSANRLRTEAQRKKPSGGFTMARVPVTAASTIAESEFNRYYIRALCKRALGEELPTVEVYRARHSEDPRSESEVLIGRTISAQQLLSDLQTHNGVEAALGLARPNSGLSVKLK